MDMLDLGDIDAADEASMEVTIGGKPSGWFWVFAGPGHAKGIAQATRLSRERLAQEREQAQARVNGKKWRADSDSPDEVREKNISFVVERLIRWSPETVKLGGEEITFSEDAVRKLLRDPRKGAILMQGIEFLAEDKSFTKRSAES